MQIHELNNFTGTLGSGAYLAVDDGNDTGKLSTQQLLAATEARIDNIIAGPAPSAEEIVDARLGDDGVTYPSLGDAIRDQVGDLKSDLSAINNEPMLKWNIGKSIAANGSINNSNYTALTDIVLAQGGDRVVWTGGVFDNAHNALVRNIATYKSVNSLNDTFIERIAMGSPIVLNSNVTGYRFHFGRASASGVTIQESDITTYFSVEIYQKFATELEHKELLDVVSANNIDRMIQNRGLADIVTPVILSNDWENGTIDGTTGENAYSAYQIRTPFYAFKGEVLFSGIKQGVGETYERAVFAYFYDADKAYISRDGLADGFSTAPTNTCYVRLTYGFSMTSGITVSNYGKSNLIADWSCSFNPARQMLKINEEIGAVGAMTAIAETYLNQAYSADNQIVYESGYGIYTNPINEQGKKATVCSQFMKSLLMGTPYEYSRYVQNDNAESWWSYEYDSSTDAVFESGGRGYLISDQIAKYCEDKGWLIPFDSAHNNIRPGDVIFWSDDERTDKYLKVVHCAICLYVYWEGCYIIHAGGNKPRPIDGEDVGIEVYKVRWSSYTPSYYARLPLVDGKYTNQLLAEDIRSHSGTYSTTTTSMYYYDYDSLPMGIYSMLWEDDGNGIDYIKINPDGINVNIEACKQGNKYYAIFYATEPIVRIDMRSGQGTTYDLKNVQLYKGYKVNSL